MHYTASYSPSRFYVFCPLVVKALVAGKMVKKFGQIFFSATGLYFHVWKNPRTNRKWKQRFCKRNTWFWRATCDWKVTVGSPSVFLKQVTVLCFETGVIRFLFGCHVECFSGVLSSTGDATNTNLQDTKLVTLCSRLTSNTLHLQK